MFEIPRALQNELWRAPFQSCGLRIHPRPEYQEPRYLNDFRVEIAMRLVYCEPHRCVAHSSLPPDCRHILDKCNRASTLNLLTAHQLFAGFRIAVHAAGTGRPRSRIPAPVNSIKEKANES